MKLMLGAVTLDKPLQTELILQPIELIPSAKRLIKSLRDMGYDFSQAVADIVDNSIEAKATVVAIDVVFNGDDSWLRIADNGTGMRPEELREAMRYGAEREYEEDDLGKFGLGLKTASMSQCQRLSVASRWNPERADVAGLPDILYQGDC
jgi:signal transduction histidine kinase